MSDKDGQFTYTYIKTIQFGIKTKVTVYPKPANSYTGVYFTVLTEDAVLTVTNIAGKPIQQTILGKNTVSFNLETAKLFSGTYYIKSKNCNYR